MGKVSFGLQYAGSAVQSGLMDVRDLAPALLAIGDLCEQANYEINGTQTKASVQIRTVAPGSVTVILLLNVGPLTAIATALGLKLAADGPLKTAKDILDLVKSGIDLVKSLGGRKVESATQLDNGMTRLVVVEHRGGVENRVTHDVSDRLYAYLNRRSVQKDFKGIIVPLKSEGVDALNFLEDGKVSESVTVDDIDAFEGLPLALPKPEERLIEETSTIEKWFTIVTISSDGRSNWRLTDGRNSYSVKVDDRDLLEAAKAGKLGIEPGFTVRARVRTVTRWIDGTPDTENYLEAILDVKPPEPRQEDEPQLF